MVTTKKYLIGIATAPFMALELLPDGCLTKPACLDELFKVDALAFRMTLSCLLNPDLKYPSNLGHQTGWTTTQF